VKCSRLAVAGIAVAALGLLGCTSNPSTKAVAKDMVQSIRTPDGNLLPQAQQDCMLDVIDKMSDDQLKKLGADNEDATFTAQGGGNAAMQAFIDELKGCPSDGSASTSTTTPGSTPDGGSTADSPAATTTTLG
jgi:hypothetical protein